MMRAAPGHQNSNNEVFSQRIDIRAQDKSSNL